MAEARTLDGIRTELRAMLPELRQHWPIAYLGVFGSWLRSRHRTGSDLDLLVDFDGPMDLYAYVELEQEISRRLGVRVDLVHRAGLKPFVGARILAEVEPL